jgi:D-serine deaminase-like pyridoxal phosphate-dependent protein
LEILFEQIDVEITILERANRIGRAGTSLDTPAQTIDVDILDRNIERLQNYLSQHGNYNDN